MEGIVKKFITHSLSGEDILNICNNEANLVINSELDHYDNIEDVLGPYNACILLYDKKNGEPGHWSCIYKENKNTINFFCPYGYLIDDATDIIGGNKNLSRLISQSNYNFNYNKFKLQQLKKNVNVCGRWVGMRLVLRDLSNQQFYKLFTSNKCYSPDFWVCILTLFCEN